MRRTTRRVLQYIFIAFLIVTIGPYLLKKVSNQGQSLEETHGLPREPNSKQNSWKIVKNDEESMEKDWHDYAAIAKEKERRGPGEQGQGVQIGPEEEEKKKTLYRENGFNGLASDKMSLDRALNDIRHPNCMKKKYLSKLYTASIVVPFHNEHITTLLRLVHSIINRSPPELLADIILVDDFSTKEFLKDSLDKTLKDPYYQGKVSVLRNKEREGLIRTRINGANIAKGDVIIFLDSHCEVNINWLPPLLDPISRKKETVVCPFIDVLDHDTFQYRAQDEGARGAFDWELFYKRLPLRPGDQVNPASEFESPVMAGGLFAIHRDWFEKLGKYDDQLEIWGGEQYELSFKIWQCGGKMVDAPCSRIGHVYRKFAPFPNPGKGDFVGRNYKRVAEVWMDEYKEFIYKRRPRYRNIDAGDLTKQKKLREDLNCKSFKWFMTNVANDLEKYYPSVEPTPAAKGELKNEKAGLCVDTKFKGQHEQIGLDTCLSVDSGHGGEQNLELSWHRDLRPSKRSMCFDVSQTVRKAPVILYNCHGMKGNQWFKYNVKTHQIYHPVSSQCLDCDPEQRQIFMNPCDEHSPTQKWSFASLNATLAEKYFNER